MLEAGSKTDPTLAELAEEEAKVLFVWVDRFLRKIRNVTAYFALFLFLSLFAFSVVLSYCVWKMMFSQLV